MSLLCAPGTWNGLENATSQVDCAACSAGSSCNAGATTPDACGAGSVSSSSASVCTACSAGEFQQASGESACVACPSGSYCLERSATPTACRPGSAALPASSECSLCNAGSYQSEAGASSCVDCKLGAFCPLGASLELAAQCERGTYHDELDGDGDPACLSVQWAHTAWDLTSPHLYVQRQRTRLNQGSLHARTARPCASPLARALWKPTSASALRPST